MFCEAVYTSLANSLHLLKFTFILIMIIDVLAQVMSLITTIAIPTLLYKGKVPSQLGYPQIFLSINHLYHILLHSIMIASLPIILHTNVLRVETKLEYTREMDERERDRRPT